MAAINQIKLRGQLVEHYNGLIRNLTRRLGSLDFAREALHETFLRLDRVTDVEPVRSPADYILRTAINIAKDRQKTQNYPVSSSEIDALLDICDDRPDPARGAETRSEVEAFKRALAELPLRSREVLCSIAIEGQPPHEVAARLQVCIRTVESDLKLALGHCAKMLNHTLCRRLGDPRPQS